MEAKWVKRMALRIAKPDHEYFKPYRKQHYEFKGIKTTLDPINEFTFAFSGNRFQDPIPFNPRKK